MRDAKCDGERRPTLNYPNSAKHVRQVMCSNFQTTMTSSNIFPTAPPLYPGSLLMIFIRPQRSTPIHQIQLWYVTTSPRRRMSSTLLKPRWLLLALKFGENGLHATSKRRGTQKVEWADVGAFTVSRVEAIIKRYQPLTWRLLNRIAGEKDVDGAPAVRKRRPTSTARTLILMF